MERTSAVVIGNGCKRISGAESKRDRKAQRHHGLFGNAKRSEVQTERGDEANEETGRNGKKREGMTAKFVGTRLRMCIRSQWRPLAQNLKRVQL